MVDNLISHLASIHALVQIIPIAIIGYEFLDLSCATFLC
jgi:hypothetical protein